MLLVLFDIHLNILSSRCTALYSTSKCNSNIEVSVKKDNICIIVSSDLNASHQLSIDVPKNLFDLRTILPCENSTSYTVSKEDNSVKLSSCLTEISNNKNNLKLQFRLQVTDANAVEKCILREFPIIKFKDFMKSKCNPYQNYNLYCTNCSSLLTSKEISFEFIHVYHEGASELSETWFCHAHDSHEVSQPNSDTLYIGDVYFYLNVSVVNNLMVSDSKKDYQCLKCLSVLSLKRTMNHQNYIGFFCDKVMFQNAISESCDIKSYSSDVALSSFYSAFEDIIKLTISCKLYLQCRVGEVTECLLLWTNSQKVLQFLIHEADNKNIPSEATFKVKEVHKVLYQFCAFESEVAKKWRHDFNVEFLEISDNTMRAVRDLLQEGYGDEDAVDGFLFGYLPSHTYVA